MEKKIVLVALVFGFTAIVLGAFGAHALKKIFSPLQLESFETGVKYQMYHALFLLAIANINLISIKDKLICFYLTIFGVLFFSGSIYLLNFMSYYGIKNKLIAIITPLGGLLLLSAWVKLFFAIITKKSF